MLDLALDIRAASEAAHGRRKAAHDLLEKGLDEAVERRDSRRARSLVLQSLLLDVAYGYDPLRFLSAPADSSREGRVVRGLTAVARGDLTAARRALQSLRREKTAAPAGVMVGMRTLEAWLIGESGDWRRAAQQLDSLARLGEEPERDLSPALVRWLAAQAHLRSGDLQSAASMFELARSSKDQFWERKVDVRAIDAAARARVEAIRRGRVTSPEG